MKRKKRGSSLVGLAFAVLILLVVAFLVRLTMHRPPEVKLPELSDIAGSGAAAPDGTQEAIRRVEVTPGTVQRVIERLDRPDNYARTVVIERLWADGSGETTIRVRAADGWTRVDSAEDGTEERHVVTGEGKSWIWYGEGGRVYSGAAALTADEEQGIPTYEAILALPVDAIVAADYRALEGVECVYVETAEDGYGYAQRFWVGAESGLLVAAERVSGGEVVYRMTGLELTRDSVTSDAFRLPDGETLYRPRKEEDMEEG